MPTPSRTRILIGVVAWNGRNWLERCINSLLGEAREGDRLVVVDNGSQDGSVGWLRERFGNQVEIISRPTNEGFAAGCNHLLKRMWSGGAGATLIVNQDTWIEPGALDRLVEAFEGSPSPMGLLTPLQLGYERDNLDPAFERLLTRHDISLHEIGNETLIPLPTVIGAAMFISREAVERIGGFDEFYFAYAEEDDFIRRLAYHELGCGLVPGARLHHHHTKGRSDMGRWLRRRNLRNVFILSLKNPERSFPHVLWRYFSRELWSIVRNCGSLRDPGYLLTCAVMQFYLVIVLPRIWVTRRREKAGRVHLELETSDLD